MHYKSLIIGIFLPAFTLSCLFSRAQVFTSFSLLEKQVNFLPLVLQEHVAQLDTAIVDINTSINPNIQIIKKKYFVYGGFSLAIKNDSGYAIYSILGEGRAYLPFPEPDTQSLALRPFNFGSRAKYVLEINHLQQVRLSKRGKALLIIRFKDTQYYSRGNGFERIIEGCLIIDLDRLQFLTIYNHERFEDWPYGDRMYITNSGMTHEAFYEIYFKDSCLKTITEDEAKHKIIHDYQYRDGVLLRIK